MNHKSEIIPLLRQEEGVRYSPYIDSLGYPTTGVGFKLGPAGAPLSHYTFTLDDDTIDAWLYSYAAGGADTAVTTIHYSVGKQRSKA
ncbi:MAG: hypothetical protein RSD94_02895 [Acinetobacter sp.]